MADLKTNYVDDVLDTTKNQLRKYQQIQNDDGTVSFVDVTEYTQVGTSFGAKDINDTNAAINDVNGNLNNKGKELVSYRQDSGTITVEDFTRYKALVFTLAQDTSSNVLASSIYVPTWTFKNNDFRFVVHNNVTSAYDSNSACAFRYISDTQIKVINYSATMVYKIDGLM